MKSNITFIDYDDEKINRSSIVNINKEIIKYTHKYRKIGEPIGMVKEYYALLLYIKFIIEKENLNYSDIINGNTESLTPFVEGKMKEFLISQFTKFKLYELLKLIAFEDYYIESYQDRILDSYIEPDKKYLLISSFTTPYIKYPNVDIYDEDGYYDILNRYSNTISRYKIYDEIIGVDRKYLYERKQFSKSDYDAIIYINDDQYKRYHDFEFQYGSRYSKLFMVCKYSDVSNYRSITNGISDREIEDKIQKVYIDNDKMYIEYDRFKRYSESTMINIQLLTNISLDRLKEVMNSTVPIDDVSIYVSPKDIINNNKRIGFNAYNKKREKKQGDILDIVDDNKKILKRISQLDKIIADQVDKMIIK